MAIVREREPQLGTPYLAVLAESAPKVNGSRSIQVFWQIQ